MAVFGPIPLQAGFTSMGELADLMMEKRKMEQAKYLEELKNAQRAKEAAEHAKYQQGMLGVSQSAEGREKALHQYKLAHEKAQAIVDQRFANMYKQGGQASPSDIPTGQGQTPPPGPAPTDTSMLNSMIQNGNPDQPSRVPGSAPRMGTPPDIVRQHPDLDYQQRVAQTQNQGMQNPYSPIPSMQQQQPGASGSFMSAAPQVANVTSQPGMPTSGQPPQAQPQQAPTQSQVSPFVERQQRLDKGEEVVERGPRPGESWKDDFAGQTHLGIKIKDIDPRVVDGIEYRTYPSGKQTAFKVGPNYEEKEEMKLNTAQTKLQAKANVTASDKAEATGKTAFKAADYIKEMVDEFIKDPNLTSIKYAVPIVGPLMAKNAGEGLGNFDAAAANYQGLAANLQSSRAGIGMVNFVKNTKPDRENSPERNRGMLISNAKKVQAIYQAEKAEWERKNPGKTYPIEDPKVVEYAQRLLNNDQTVIIIDPSGHEHEILESHLSAALAKHPGTKLKGAQNAV